ncbi:conserved membrane protein of unknown function [Candidatus Hydrogenisulfobacillus filiaventi]|uniref:Uncharacterized protein n=1 Tax=Candidatus Hydrogenisulfobacillus filiaventi TaxID=2707344 RepID=A0A6F8ZG84_9FIRM|nr:hypothetical protein [Bacillota bacterium]CAB1128948.1 conserved membrane protein of unknown function [Candidatus Hydrogenisulfobacillus filiaventi]
MWEQRHVQAVAVWPWVVVGAVLLLPPVAAVTLWIAGHLSGFRAALGALGQGGLLWAGWLGLRALTAGVYNRWIGPRHGYRFWLEGQEIMAVDARSALLPALAGGILEGGGLTVLLGLLGWLHPVVALLGWGWPLAAGVTAGFLLVEGSVLLYNRVVVPFYGTLTWPEEAAGGEDWTRVAALDPNGIRLVSATLFFAWVLVAVVLTVGGLYLALTVLARHLPAGYFGFSIAIFSGFLTALGGFLVAVATGWWMYLLAVAYNRWLGRGGGVRLRLGRAAGGW